MFNVQKKQLGTNESVKFIGRWDIFETKKCSFFCSVKTPGDIILKTFDYAKLLRNKQVTVISGFHSPMEQECLRILLKGSQPIIACPARSINNMRIPSIWKKYVEQKQMLIVSPFDQKNKRTTSTTAQVRNQFIAKIADHIFVAHAAPNSKTFALCQSVMETGKEVHTIDSPHNQALIAKGAKTIAL